MHPAAVDKVLPEVAEALLRAGVRLRGCAATLAVLEAARGRVEAQHKETGAEGEVPTVEAASDADFDTEWLSLCISIKAVEGVDAAIAHVNEHGSGHTDCILCEDKTVANHFLSRVLSAACFHNASTRFCDGFRFGFGAESGISTSKVHARGPVGLEGLCLYKYKLLGDGVDPGVPVEGVAASAGREGTSGAGGSAGGVHAVADFGLARSFEHKDMDGVPHGADETSVLKRLGYLE